MNGRRMKQVLVYGHFERFWHWAQAGLIFFLTLTGFEIHGTFIFFNYENAVQYHSVAALLFALLIAFAIFWHVTTGQWKQYVPTRSMLRAQMEYYVAGIFRDAPHPTRKTVLSKLNPLQKMVYAGLKILVIPGMVSTGLLYLFYRYPQKNDVMLLNVNGLRTIAVLHTLGAFALLAFIISHLYLITTGETLTSNLRAMITGNEMLEEDEPADAGTGED